MSTQSPRAHKPASRWIWCTDCGHRGYHTRSDAKAVRKHHRGKGLTIFTCPHRTGDETDLFHLGHQPVALGRGRVDERTSDLLWGRLPAREWVEALASGWVDSLVPDHPAARWQWYAQILDSPRWGMSTIATGHRELYLEVAELCRTMSALPTGSTHTDSDNRYAQLEQQWQAVDAAVMSAIGDHDPTPVSRDSSGAACDRGVFEALDTIIEITTDALEWLRGRPAVGMEACVTAFDALLHAHSPAQGRALLIALLAHTLTDYPADFSLVDVRSTVPAGTHAIHERAAS